MADIQELPPPPPPFLRVKTICLSLLKSDWVNQFRLLKMNHKLECLQTDNSRSKQNSVPKPDISTPQDHVTSRLALITVAESSMGRKIRDLTGTPS